MVDSILIPAPRILYHGSRSPKLNVISLGYDQVTNPQSPYRQIYGGHISMTSDIEVARAYALRLSVWEERMNPKISRHIYEFELEPNQMFFNADAKLNSNELLKYLGPAIKELYFDSEFKRTAFHLKHMELFRNINTIYTKMPTSRYSLLELFSQVLQTPEIFVPFNRVLCRRNNVIGIVGKLPFIDDLGVEQQWSDYSIHDITKIKLLSSKPIYRD